MDATQEPTGDIGKLKPSSRRFDRRAYRFGGAALLLGAGLLAACADEPPPYEPPEIGPRLVSDLSLERRWPNGVIPYKFAPNPNLLEFEMKKDRVRAAMNGSTTIGGCTTDPCIGWGGANTLRFVECPPNDLHCGDYKYYAYMIVGEENRTRVKRGFSALQSETIDSERCPNGLADTVAGRDCRTGPCDWGSGEHCVFDIWVRVNGRGGFMWNAAHEMGHLLGFQHEQSRPDRAGFIETTTCSTVPQWTDDVHLLSEEEFIGSYDVRSVMHYVDAYDPVAPNGDTCFTSLPGDPIGGFRNDDLPTAQDLAKLQLLYGVRGDWVLDSNWCIRGGRQIHVGDFNGDGRQDLLCHSAEAGFYATGRRWLDFADSAGAFDGTDAGGDTSQFCWGSSRRLLVGDFDGDGRDDVLCYNRDRGTVTVDYANARGELGGQDWPASEPQAWPCDEAGSEAYVGDFNGDGRDDLLCHNSETGSRWIDWADEEGRFGGPDWTSESAGNPSWCTGANERILIGDFNGDGRDDAVCHDTQTGHRKIDLASVDGDLKGTNWDSRDYGATPFCWGSHRTVYAADVNGDGADDLLCHNAQIGSVSVDLADPEMGSEHGVGLRGIDSFHQLAFCNADDAQLIVGAFDSGNARADLLCHNRVTGHKAILYGREDGTYQVPPGY